MPGQNQFMLRALASDPLISASLMPKKTQIEKTPASNLDQELSDSDLPSSVVDEIEVWNFQSVICVQNLQDVNF